MTDLPDDLPSLRALAAHQQRTIDRLLAERETHLAQVEQAFRRRHNDQITQIEKLKQQVAALRQQTKEKRSA